MAVPRKRSADIKGGAPMKVLRLAASAAFVLSIGGHARAQQCKPESFTIQDVDED